ncbi:MAG TPA: hypothetical protein VGO90_13065 [Chthoniobacteraceae bacterium]|nr:hypothetical protein [Chthoniobacteraceae bacterium]
MSMLVESPAVEQRPRAADALAPLTRQLTKADRVLQGEKGARVVLAAWLWVIGYLVAALLLDVSLHLAAGPRVAIGVGLMLLGVGILVTGAVIAWFRRNSLEHTARILESRDARLGSKLINVLQLQAQATDPKLAPLTRELASMAIGGYATELATERLAERAKTDRVKREAKRMGYGLVGFAAVLAIFFPITRTELPRFFDPFGDHPPYSFTRLEISDPGDDTTSVVYGEGLLISVKVRGHRPGELFLTFFPADAPATKTTVPMFDKGERGFTQQIDSIKANLVIFAHTRNEHSRSKHRRVGVILTPKLEKAFVKIAPPAYTGLPADERPLQFKSLKALAGSALTFRLQSNRPLSHGTIMVTLESGAVQPIKMTPTVENEVAGTWLVTESAQLQFSLSDRDGFESQQKWEVAFTATHDLPPEVQVTNPNSDTFVAMDFKVEPVIEASDDYGLKTIRIHQAHNGVYGEPRVIAHEKPPLHAREVLPLKLQELGLVSGDTVSFFAEAIDNAPDPHLTRSKTVTLTVITTEEYNDFLRERMDISDIEAKYRKLLNEFHDRVEEQRKLGEAIEALKKQEAAAKTESAKAAAQKKLAELATQQEQLNQQLNDLAHTMETFVRDDPLYDIEAELKNTLAEKAQEIRDSTQANEAAMEEITESRLPGEETPANPGKSSPKTAKASGLNQKMLADFKKASDEQLERLGATEQSAAEEIAEPLKDMSLIHEIVKDINRFKELYAAQKELAEQAKAYDRATPLSREDQLALKSLAAQEKEIGEQLDAVEQKLWEDGEAAEAKFPKAAKSAKDIAQTMGDLRLQTLANQATRSMLEGQGDQSAQRAENLRGEMEKLFSQCEGQGGEMGSELDQFLAVQRGLKAGSSFSQMMQSRKFGSGSKAGGMGQGSAGSHGYAVITGPNANVMGNESMISESTKAELSGQGKNNAAPNAAGAQASIDKQDVVTGMEAVNRESGAVQGETGIEQYSGIVEQYFKALTKPAPKAKETKP